MAKKKPTRKKTATRATGRKKAAGPVSKKKKKSSGKKKTMARKVAKKAARTTARKTAKKPAAAKKTATRSAKAPAARTAAKVARKTAKTAKKPSRSKAGPPRPAPDANGYVIINGRRVRMMSASTRPPGTRRAVEYAQSAAGPAPKAASDKPIKTKLTKKDLDRYRNLLIIQRAELVGDLSAMEAQALQATGGNLSHMPIHMADIGTDTFDQDFMLGMAENERRRLREIDAALKRIEDRTYGICQMTGKPIPKTRLNAKPWAQYTIEAAREIERGGSE